MLRTLVFSPHISPSDPFPEGHLPPRAAAPRHVLPAQTSDSCRRPHLDVPRFTKCKLSKETSSPSRLETETSFLSPHHSPPPSKASVRPFGLVLPRKRLASSTAPPHFSSPVPDWLCPAIQPHPSGLPSPPRSPHVLCVSAECTPRLKPCRGPQSRRRVRAGQGASGSPKCACASSSPET